MGYGMSRLDEEYSKHEGQNSDGPSSVQTNNEFLKLHNDIFQMTRIKSGPSESIRKSIGTSKDTISTTRLLSGREVISSGNGKFSSVDRAFVLGRYLPVDDPEIVNRMDSRAYVSQFSADGSLFVAGFQGSHIRIYDVDKGWKVHKDIHARSLRWTISDASLSPDQRFLVYSSLAPIIHIVNVGTAARESYANVTFHVQVSGSQVAKLKGYHQLAIRDCGWHPFDPMLVSSSWDGQIAKWSRTSSDQDTSELD